jgi:hypothetical protein
MSEAPNLLTIVLFNESRSTFEWERFAVIDDQQRVHDPATLEVEEGLFLKRSGGYDGEITRGTPVCYFRPEGENALCSYGVKTLIQLPAEKWQQAYADWKRTTATFDEFLKSYA